MNLKDKKSIERFVNAMNLKELTILYKHLRSIDFSNQDFMEETDGGDLETGVLGSSLSQGDEKP